MRDYTPLPEREARLIGLAAKLLGLAMDVANQSNAVLDPGAVDESVRQHDELKLYPRLTITAQHGGGGMHLALALNHPDTDEPHFRLLEIEASEGAGVWKN